MDHKFRADTHVLTVYVDSFYYSFACPSSSMVEFLMSLASSHWLPSRQGSYLALDMLGNGRTVLRIIFLDVAEMCFDMFAGTIMCYGQTGAGKTYTMTGATENYKHRGILPRALQQVESGPIGGMLHRSPLYAIDAVKSRSATRNNGI